MFEAASGIKMEKPLRLVHKFDLDPLNYVH